MRGRALAASRSALTRPPQTWSGTSLRATRFDDDYGDDEMVVVVMMMMVMIYMIIPFQILA